MHRQVGWTGLLERLKNEAPHYAQMLPELPRLIHKALERRPETDPALLAMVVEQRRTNRLLQSVLFGVIGFVVGALVMQIIFRWRGL